MARALPVLMQLDDIRIASPCKASWNDMTGTDRVRFCAACQKSVFHLSGMKRSEAQELIRATEGKICARFYRRSDGTILTADCPVGLALAARKAKRAVLGVVAASAGAVVAVLAFFATTPVARVVDVTPIREAVQRVETETLQRKVELEPIAGGLQAPPLELVMGTMINDSTD